MLDTVIRLFIRKRVAIDPLLGSVAEIVLILSHLCYSHRISPEINLAAEMTLAIGSESTYELDPINRDS
jgi:hypothetical protein